MSVARARASGLLLLLASAWAGAGCVSKEVRDSAKDVLTLRSGTVSELRDQRGQGPFHLYDVAPSEMLQVAAAACRKAVGLRGRPVTTVEVSPRYGEVTAKEQAQVFSAAAEKEQIQEDSRFADLFHISALADI